MLAQWTGDVVGIMHTHKITAKQLAERLSWNDKYLSSVLNGKREPKDAEAKVRAALDELIAERNEK